MQQQPWKCLRSERTGLTSKEVVQRIESGQSNAVKTSTSRSVEYIVRANVFTLFNGIIFAAMVLVLITGSWRDAVFGFVIIINTGIGIVTELRAKRTLDRLPSLWPPNSSCVVTAGTWRCPTTRSCSTTCCGSVPANRCRPTGRSSRPGDWNSTNPCSPANLRTVRHKVGEQVLFRSHRGLRHGVGQGQCRGQPFLRRHAHRCRPRSTRRPCPT